MIKNNQQKTIKILLLAGIIVLIAVIALYFYLSPETARQTTSDEEGSGAVVFTVIWPAIMIPIIVRNKKKQELNQRETKIQKHLLIALTITLILGIISLLVVTFL